MCPQCGKVEPVLQSVVTDRYECRAELGGCGAEFDKPASDCVPEADSVCRAIAAMHEAIRKFEQQDFPLGYEPILEMRRQADELLKVLKHEIGRIATLFEKS
jgi:hypothetical protein